MRFADFLPETTKIMRDGQFSSLGSLFSHYPHQLVYATREADIKKIVDNPSISCVITIPELVSKIPQNISTASDPDPRNAFYALQSVLVQYPEFVLQPFPNQISPSAKIHPSAVISAHSVSLGRDVVIEKNVVISEQTIIDEGSIVRSNSIIGSFPLPPRGAMNFPMIHPSGGVRLHREVDIHANNRIDRAIFKGYTEIGEQAKLDNLNAIGQGTTIGKRCLICAGVTIGECVLVGNDTWLGPNVTLDHQIGIGNNNYITIGSKVTRDMEDNKVVKDNYAIDRKRFRKVIRGM